ncbi:unnamed protein product, partial [Owenia fusiformis]
LSPTMNWEENLFVKVVSFRQNPTLCIGNLKLEEDDFVLDVLQALCSDVIVHSDKCHLLDILDEYAISLLQTPAIIEQTIGSLLDIFNQSVEDGNVIYRAQLLHTITSILVQLEQIEHQATLFKSFTELLLETCSKVNNTPNKLLRLAACQSLQEIEVSYPGVLCRKLEYLYQMSQMEHSNICQAYMTLFVTALRNTIHLLAKQETSSAPGVLNEMLCDRTEPLKPLVLPNNLADIQLTPPQNERKLDNSIDTKELRSAVSYIMDYCAVLTHSSLFYVITELIKIFHMVPVMSPTIFKSHFLRHISSSDLPLFHSTILLKLHFGDDLVSSAENDALLDRIIILANQTSLFPAQKLLSYHWLLHYPQNKNCIPKEPCLPPYYLHKEKYFIPQIFDGFDTQLKKLTILSVLYVQSNTVPPPETLMGCISNLTKSIRKGVGGRTAATCYKILFVYYTMFSEHQAVVEEIKRFIIDIVKLHPKFASYSLDFLHVVTQKMPESSLAHDSLLDLTNHITDLQSCDVQEHFHNYMTILEKAAQMPSIDQKPTISYLSGLLDTLPMGSERDWLSGSAVLAVCRAILQHQNTSPLFQVLGEVLYKLSSQHNDIDIKDRARCLYALLMNLSSEKITNILTEAPVESRDRSQNLANLVTASANFPTAEPITRLDQSILELCRQRCRREEKEKVSEENMSLGKADDIKSYVEQLNEPTFKPHVSLTYEIQFVKDNSTQFDKIYAVQFKFKVHENYQQIPDVCIPHLSKNAACPCITLRLYPELPLPTDISVQFSFMSKDGSTYMSSMKHLNVQFSDLFLRCPCPNVLQHVNSEASDTSPPVLESVFTIGLTSSCVEALIEEHFAEFVVPTSIEVSQDCPIVDMKTKRVAIFLPRRYHLMMTFTINDDRTVVAIETDSLTILPKINALLKDIVEKWKSN